MKVVGGDVSGNDCGDGNHSDAPLHPGETVTASGVTITVLARIAGPFLVSVSAPA